MTIKSYVQFDVENNTGVLVTRGVTERSESGAARTTVVASTASPDHANDIVDQTWDLEAYRANPVVMWAHRYNEPPVGRAVDVGMDGDSLKAVIEWDASEHNDRGRLMAHQFARGFMSAVSVGFRPGSSVARSALEENDPRYASSGYVLADNTLLEISAAPVPMNDEALAARVMRAYRGARGMADYSEHLDIVREALRGDVRAALMALLRDDPEVARQLSDSVWGAELDVGSGSNDADDTVPWDDSTPLAQLFELPR